MSVALSVSAGRQRSFMAAFPTGVTVVTAFDADGRPHGMTCTSLASVTLNPPTVLVCLGNGATLNAIKQTGWYAINLLHADSSGTAEIFAGTAPDKFAQAEWEHSPASGVPWLVGAAFASAACEVRETITLGDHDVVVGEVRELTQREEIPLLYGMRQYAAWPAP